MCYERCACVRRCDAREKWTGSEREDRPSSRWGSFIGSSTAEWWSWWWWWWWSLQRDHVDGEERAVIMKVKVDDGKGWIQSRRDWDKWQVRDTESLVYPTKVIYCALSHIRRFDIVSNRIDSPPAFSKVSETTATETASPVRERAPFLSDFDLPTLDWHTLSLSASVMSSRATST